MVLQLPSKKVLATMIAIILMCVAVSLMVFGIFFANTLMLLAGIVLLMTTFAVTYDFSLFLSEFQNPFVQFARGVMTLAPACGAGTAMSSIGKIAFSLSSVSQFCTFVVVSLVLLILHAKAKEHGFKAW